MNYQRVNPGDSLRISARDWNMVRQCAAHAERLNGVQKGAGLNGALGYGEFFGVAIDTQFLLGQCGYVRGFAALPADIAACPENYTLEVCQADYDMEAPLCIAMESVRKGEVGRFKVAGYCLARWKGDDPLVEYAIPDGNGDLVPCDDHGVSVIAASPPQGMALVLLSGSSSGRALLGMFDSSASINGNSVRLKVFNSMEPDSKYAGILAVNGQHLQVPRGEATVSLGSRRYIYVHFRPAKYADEASDLDSGGNPGADTAAMAEMHQWDQLLQSSPDDVYVLVAVLHEDGTLEKVRPRGIVEAVWYGPARDLWKDVVATGKR